MIGDEGDIVGQILVAVSAVADGIHPGNGVLIDDGLLAVVLLDVQPGRQHPDDRHERKADDRQAQGDLDHGEGGAVGGDFPQARPR